MMVSGDRELVLPVVWFNMVTLSMLLNIASFSSLVRMSGNSVFFGMSSF
jgi:hypothetical protein